jgi:hypothetical protein
MDMVSRTQAEQPRWLAPLVTVTPLLTQLFHYDVSTERLPDGSRLTSFGGGKGLEFVPFRNIGIIIAVPPYEERTGSTWRSGVGDWPSVLMKYRFSSASADAGNYVVTGFLQYIAGNGTPGFSAGTDIIQPTLAAGKGWGAFNVQANLGIQIPLSGNQFARNYGDPIIANVTAQYQLWQYVWPEFELNFSWWPDGLRQGNGQLFVTPGIIFGPMPLRDRWKFAVGAGYQFPVTAMPAFNGNFILTARLYF